MKIKVIVKAFCDWLNVLITEEPKITRANEVLYNLNQN